MGYIVLRALCEGAIRDAGFGVRRVVLSICLRRQARCFLDETLTRLSCGAIVPLLPRFAPCMLLAVVSDVPRGSCVLGFSRMLRTALFIDSFRKITMCFSRFGPRTSTPLLSSDLYLYI